MVVRGDLYPYGAGGACGGNWVVGPRRPLQRLEMFATLAEAVCSQEDEFQFPVVFLGYI